MTTSARIIYAGTPDFAVPPLTALHAAGYEVVAVYTQPDRPAGRGRELKASPVKQEALRLDIPVYQPQSLKAPEEQASLAAHGADLMIVAAYGLILPQAVLDIPRLGCINIHASLLPRWRGAAPIQRAILGGDSVTGITIMHMDVGLDTGDMLCTSECDINSDDTGSSLHDKLMALGAETLMSCLPGVLSGTAEPVKQDDAASCYAPKLSKQEAEIDWSRPADEIERQVRAFNAWPVAYTGFKRKQAIDNLRVWRAEVVTQSSQAAAGSVLSCDRDGIVVACGDNCLRLLELQAAGKRRMSAAEFANAHDLSGQQLTTRTEGQ